MTSVTSLIRQYQKIQKQYAKLNTRKQKLQEQVQRLAEEQSHVASDLKDVKTLIDFCIEANTSPTQAKLSHSLSEMQTILDNSRVYGSQYGQFTNIGITPGSVNISGGLGSNNLISYPYHSSVSGASGPSYAITSMLGTTPVSVTNPGNISLLGSLKGSVGP